MFCIQCFGTLNPMVVPNSMVVQRMNQFQSHEKALDCDLHQETLQTTHCFHSIPIRLYRLQDCVEVCHSV